MQKMCWKILNECCGCSVMQSASSLASQCFPGHLDCARPTAPGPNIGTAKWQDRHRFNHTARGMPKYRRIWAKFMSAVVSVMKGCMNIGCIENVCHPESRKTTRDLATQPRLRWRKNVPFINDVIQPRGDLCNP